MRHSVLERPPDMRERLLRRLEAIERQLDELALDLADATSSQLLEGTLANHPADEASDMIVAETDLSRIGDLRAEMRDIRDALDQIEQGAYGTCVDCGAALDSRRLAILPLARRCVRCQERAESRVGAVCRS